eukprot:8400742-Pyramimonas_sp.AAC.1
MAPFGLLVAMATLGTTFVALTASPDIIRVLIRVRVYPQWHGVQHQPFWRHPRFGVPKRSAFAYGARADPPALPLAGPRLGPREHMASRI